MRAQRASRIFDGAIVQLFRKRIRAAALPGMYGAGEAKGRVIGSTPSRTPPLCLTGRNRAVGADVAAAVTGRPPSTQNWGDFH
jgi:hypothetical protein